MTNADLAAEMALDLVIVSAPMSQASFRPTPTPVSVVRQPSESSCVSRWRPCGAPVCPSSLSSLTAG